MLIASHTFMKKLLYFLLPLFLVAGILFCSFFMVDNKKESVRIGFYNVENLFDTVDRKGANDNEFLPGHSKEWGTLRYERKLNQIARVILAMGDWRGIDMIGVCEVENKEVLSDLVNKTYLSAFNYDFVHKDSPDLRGIDVAFIYKKDVFSVLEYKTIQVDLHKIVDVTTRDILYVKGTIHQKDTLHIFCNHWSSRYGGAVQSELKRKIASQTLKKATDSLLQLTPQAKVIIMGDFNDTPENVSVSSFTKSYNENESFVNISNHFNASNGGTHKYQAHWHVFDQILVSEKLLINSGYYLKSDSATLFTPSWLKMEDEIYGGYKPYRTFSGPNYIGGYSDHFPIYMELIID